MIPKRNDLELYDYQNWMNQILIILSSGTFPVIYLKMIKALSLSNFSHFLFLFISDEKKIDQKDVIIGDIRYTGSSPN